MEKARHPCDRLLDDPCRGIQQPVDYILQWDSLADLETGWTAFLNDPAWHKVRDEGERDGPIVASINNQILAPTDFSALK